MDLNADLGERTGAVARGLDERFMAIVTSVNVACGGHAGDRATIEATVRAARRLGVAIGAHPGYADPGRFGRVDLDLPPGEIADSVCRQVQELAAACAAHGATLGHVKAHGALYNRAARDETVARAIADGVLRVSRELVLVGLAGSAMLDTFRRAGFAVVAEAFADRRYEAGRHAASPRLRRRPDRRSGGGCRTGGIDRARPPRRRLGRERRADRSADDLHPLRHAGGPRDRPRGSRGARSGRSAGASLLARRGAARPTRRR